MANQGGGGSRLDLLEIIQGVLNGDGVALDKLVLWITRRLAYAWVLNQKGALINVSVRHEEDQKEVCQDVLMEIVQRFRSRPPCPADKTDGYVARIVGSKAVDFHRRRAAKKRCGEELMGEIPEQEPQEPTMDDDKKRAIRAFIAQLPDCERAAAEGYMLGESAEQTAARTGIALGTLKHCRVRVRKLIQDRFGPQSRK